MLIPTINATMIDEPSAIAMTIPVLRPAYNYIVGLIHDSISIALLGS